MIRFATRNRLFYVALLCVSFLTGCATIVSKSSYPLMVSSHPGGAEIVITDKKGKDIFKGNTPATISLKAGAGFFSRAEYHVHFSMAGYQSKTVPVNFKLDGWYFGNFIFGSFIGLLIIDPASGAMWKIESSYLNETLFPLHQSAETEPGLLIYSIHDIPDSWKEHLVELDSDVASK